MPERSIISNKSRNIDFYLNEIEDMKWIEFDKLVPYSTAGDYRVPYAFHWVAYCKARPGDDDPYMGEGGTPLEAVRDLYHALKKAENEPVDDEQQFVEDGMTERFEELPWNKAR